MGENNNIRIKYSEEDLLKYLNQDISGEEANRLEKEMLEDPFLKDALEGLQAYSSVSKMRKDVLSIDSKLKQQINTRPERKRKKLKDLNLALYVLFFIIILLLIAFVILQGYK
ncbi:hypothetical protein ACFSPU_07580 [Haoranjiania flava]|uniref:Uncharacterized protein n=1 Tax=Haoranjiania flava TaxID=1856322 RepID=A0AAE3ILS7_9BACT|nr:hypothetical protein [Haoranjiania flava]MCU7694507.1 hypothetical protein [Haoranjiania flava]